MKIYIKNRVRRHEEFQFFMHQFVEACINNGFNSVPDYIPTTKFYIQSILRRGLIGIYKILHILNHNIFSKKKALLVTSNADFVQYHLFPYFFNYEVVPMLWDAWPYSWERMYKSFELFDVKTVLVTSSQVAEQINNQTNIHAYWIPEGIDSTGYKNEKRLKDRSINVLEMGRQHPKLHSILVQMVKQGVLTDVVSSKINTDGTLNPNKLAFNTFEDLTKALSDSKILICFPQCDTNPQRAGKIETLTQRYWEGMHSGCIMLGRAPKELIDVIGYNPVVEIDWNNPEKQLLDILKNIESYQELIDKNYEVALKHASWDNRIPLIKDYLEKEGYSI